MDTDQDGVVSRSEYAQHPRSVEATLAYAEYMGGMAAAVPSYPRITVSANLQQPGSGSVQDRSSSGMYLQSGLQPAVEAAAAAAAGPQSVAPDRPTHIDVQQHHPDVHLADRALSLLRRQDHINQQQALPTPAPAQLQQPDHRVPYVPADGPSFDPPRSSSAASSRAATPPRRRVHGG